jgi:hypothetical protein
MEQIMTKQLNDPVPPDALPSFQPMNGPQPAMPNAWTCTALLHPFSPPSSINPQPDNPFFQLCVANIVCMQGQFFSAQIAGCIFGTWWYMVTPSGTQLSTDQGNTWSDVDVGWSLPSNWFGGQAANAACAGTAPLNWMAAQNVDWWKVPVPLPNPPPAATWMWFDSASQAPVRMMFGNGPQSPTRGDPTQLALFQMYSFSYFPLYSALQSVSQPTAWTNPTFPGFAVGNPNGYKKFVWNSNFGMTAFMTPVNENFNPLPTRVLYVWKPDGQYQVASDRAQNTLMQQSQYNPGDLQTQEALLFGPAPHGTTPPPGADLAYLISEYHSPLIQCQQFGYPQEPPDWISIPAVEGTIQATITDNPVLCPGSTVTIFSVLFPPAMPNYPDATYLWTWYSPPQGSDGTHSRPITFMQSQSGVGVGTSLALADYYYYQEFSKPIDPSNFNVPPSCRAQGGGQKHKKKALRFRLP